MSLFNSEQTMPEVQSWYIKQKLGPIYEEGREHEGRVRFVGGLFLFFGVLASLPAIYLLVNFLSPRTGSSPGMGVPFAVVALVVGIVINYFVAGFGLRGLKPWARSFGFLAALTSILAVPIGTICSIYAFWAMYSKGGNAVFSAGYLEAREALQEKKRITVSSVILALVLLTLTALIIWSVATQGKF